MVRQVRCDNETCPRSGIVAVVADRLVARGVVARPLLVCSDCGYHMTEVPDLTCVVATGPEPVSEPARRAKTKPRPKAGAPNQSVSPA